MQPASRRVEHQLPVANFHPDAARQLCLLARGAARQPQRSLHVHRVQRPARADGLLVRTPHSEPLQRGVQRAKSLAVQRDCTIRRRRHRRPLGVQRSLHEVQRAAGGVGQTCQRRHRLWIQPLQQRHRFQAKQISGDPDIVVGLVVEGREAELSAVGLGLAAPDAQQGSKEAMPAPSSMGALLRTLMARRPARPAPRTAWSSTVSA